jgi:hypothetical protein
VHHHRAAGALDRVEHDAGIIGGQVGEATAGRQPIPQGGGSAHDGSSGGDHAIGEAVDGDDHAGRWRHEARPSGFEGNDDVVGRRGGHSGGEAAGDGLDHTTAHARAR